MFTGIKCHRLALRPLPARPLMPTCYIVKIVDVTFIFLPWTDVLWSPCFNTGGYQNP